MLISSQSTLTEILRIKNLNEIVYLLYKVYRTVEENGETRNNLMHIWANDLGNSHIQE